MSEDDASGANNSVDAVPAAGDEAVEAYETEEGVVLYSTDNPLAWIESRTPVRLADAA